MAGMRQPLTVPDLYARHTIDVRLMFRRQLWCTTLCSINEFRLLRPAEQLWVIAQELEDSGAPMRPDRSRRIPQLTNKTSRQGPKGLIALVALREGCCRSRQYPPTPRHFRLLGNAA